MAIDFSDGRQVGEFSNQMLNSRKLIRSVKNPLDKCTVVSILPKTIDEVKVTIEPGMFHLNPGSYEKPSTLVVGSSSWWREIDLDQPMLEIPVSSVQVADSIVKDYCKGILGCDMQGSMPGLFFVLGEASTIDIRSKYKTKLEEMKSKQDNWFSILIRLADSLWARSNNNPLVISDDMRMAARTLHQDSKPWLKDFEAPKLVPCKACGNLRNDLYPICPSCKTIDTAHPLAKDLKFAV